MKKINVILIIIICLLLIVIKFGCYKISDILTKKSIFDIITEVEDISFGVVSKEGIRTLDEEGKIDFCVRYIIENYKKFEVKAEFNDYYESDGTPYYNFGKVTAEELKNLVNSFFGEIQYSFEEYKFYDNGNIQLNFEPIEYVGFDRKKILEVSKINRNDYKVNVEYIRTFGKFKNTFLVRYEISYDENKAKIKDIVLYSSKFE